MQFFKFNLFLLVTMLHVHAVEDLKLFNAKDCLKSVFQIQITHKTGPFGILRNHLSLNKDECIIEIKHKKITEKQWLVDVCREPVHIKVNSTGDVEVAKKDETCMSSVKEKQGFCYHSHEILNLVQDHALIFAEGLKEDISSDHGKSYCSFLLLKKYMQRDIIFSTLSEQTPSLFEVEALAPATEDKIKATSSSATTSEKAPEKTPEGSF